MVSAHLLTGQQFVDTVALGLITPGPVVMMATFAGYLVDGLTGAAIATVAVFLPIYLLVAFLGNVSLRYAERPRMAGLVKGVTAARGLRTRPGRHLTNHRGTASRGGLVLVEPWAPHFCRMIPRP